MGARTTAVLVHNIGHHDVYARMGASTDEATLFRVQGIASMAFARPVLEGLETAAHALRCTDGLETALEPPLALPWTAAKCRKRLVSRKEEADLQPNPLVVSLYFPLVDAAIDRVLRGGADTLHVVLVSAGPGGIDREAGKSTEEVARLMQRHLALRVPDVQVHLLHRCTDEPFSMQGMPDDIRRLDAMICGLRRDVVQAYGEAWARHFSVALSANTGTVSTLSAMLEGVRPHRPSLLHIRDAYRWPADGSDVPALPAVDLLDHDHFAQRPALDATVVEEEAVRRSIEEMRAWANDYREQRPLRAGQATAEGERPDPEYAFWFRKGQKEVLAVLVVRDRTSGELRAHRAVNLEVSLPTGTLCAERNAIGTAFAAHPDLHRADIEAVAVLSLDAGLGPRLGPCGACSEWLRKVAEVNPDFRVVTFADTDCAWVFVDPIEAPL